MRKPIWKVTEAEFRRHPLWKYTLDERPNEDETWATPIRFGILPRLSSKLPAALAAVATDLKLANGKTCFGILTELSRNRELREHCLNVHVFAEGALVSLIGYYSPDAPPNRVEAFAQALKLSVRETFPISYDVSRFFGGPSHLWKGEIHEQPSAPLSESEFIELIVKIGADER